MIPDEKFEANCTVIVVSDDVVADREKLAKQQRVEPKQQQQQQSPTEKHSRVSAAPHHQKQQRCDISLSAFSDIYNEYLSDHSEIETASTSDTDSSSSASLSNPASITSTSVNSQKIQPDIRSNLHSNQLFGVQLEVNFLLLEAERRKLKVLQQELNLSLDECDKFERKKRSQNQCHELLLAIS